MIDYAALETPLDPVPMFPVEPTPAPGPDPRMWPELERQKAFITYLRKTSPDLIAFAIPNAGKRGPRAVAQAKAEGMLAGAADVCVCWDWRKSTEPDPARSVCFLELKGFTSAGRPGKLSAAQIDFGNACFERGIAYGCFYTVAGALAWLASIGAPVRGRL